jgi:hypothetical protein
MQVVSSFSAIHPIVEEGWPEPFEQGYFYELLLCPACEEVVFRRNYYHDIMNEDDIKYETLYPLNERAILGLPDKVTRAYEAALKVRRIDANAYAVLIGRVLDFVCEDRKAKGKNLFEKIQDLSSRGDIPQRLADIANSLRKIRNVGAHADLGQLSDRERPLLDDLCRAILEYVYGAPYLADRAEAALDSLRKIADTEVE